MIRYEDLDNRTPRQRRRDQAVLADIRRRAPGPPLTPEELERHRDEGRRSGLGVEVTLPASLWRGVHQVLLSAGREVKHCLTRIHLADPWHPNRRDGEVTVRLTVFEWRPVIRALVNVRESSSLAAVGINVKLVIARITDAVDAALNTLESQEQTHAEPR